MPKRPKIKPGDRFGRVTIRAKASPVAGEPRWECVCDCGTEFVARDGNLKRGGTRSCGCRRKETQLALYKLTPISPDEKFGRLTTLALVPRWNGDGPCWRCVCDCGATKIVLARLLRKGDVRSCGCLLIDASRERKTIHGLTGSVEYGAWIEMRRRCYDESNKNYGRYGGRGIAVCDRWRHSFENFLADMGPKPLADLSLDRIDVNGNYEPGNCRWATALQQSRNRRNSLHSIGDQTKSLTEWCEIYGMSRDTVYARLRRGAALIDALTRPAKPITSSLLMVSKSHQSQS